MYLTASRGTRGFADQVFGGVWSTVSYKPESFRDSADSSSAAPRARAASCPDSPYTSSAFSSIFLLLSSFLLFPRPDSCKILETVSETRLNASAILEETPY
ncbi:hypothetical protein INR49_008021 [Caranx melampygus]|nr:hypothetical protein INR49_022722 [Caranx melampygus]KAG7232865.1 hypothetical protein INR49_008021 [Caranx melampygus]